MDDILDIQHADGDTIDGPSLEQIVSEGYTFQFSKYFDTGWKALSGDIGQYILFTLVAGIILLVSAFTIIGAILIAMPITSGFILYGAKVLKGEKPEFNNFFDGFKFFGPLLGYTGLMILFGLIAMVPIALLFGLNFTAFQALDDPAELNAILMATMWPIQLSYGAISIILQSLIMLTIPLIVIGNLGTMDAIRWSIKITLKNFWWFLLYAFVVSIISQAGAFVCYVGLLFTVPLGQCLTLGAYAEIVGLGDKRTLPN